MSDEVKNEAIEIITTACEKYAQNYELAAKTVKEAMDKKFGSFWHVVVGEGFGFEVSYETKNILYLFFGGNLVIILRLLIITHFILIYCIVFRQFVYGNVHEMKK